MPVIPSPHTPIDDLAEMLLNLNSVVISAGGAGFTIGQLTEMSAFDLLVGLAPNNIRFTYSLARTK